MIAMMGTNTQYLQSGLELHAELHCENSILHFKDKNAYIDL